MSASKHETVMNWNGELSLQEYAAALSSSSSPAAKWYVDLCEQVERERYEESQRAMWQSSFAPWRGPPRPNLRDNPLTPDLDAHELELARGTSIEGLNDAIDRAAGAFGLSAQHTRDVMDAIASITQIPARFLIGDPMTPPPESWIRTGAAEYLNWQARIESDAIRAVMHSRVVGQSHDLPIIDDVEIEGKW